MYLRYVFIIIQKLSDFNYSNPAWVNLILKGGIKINIILRNRIGFHHSDILCIFDFQIDALTSSVPVMVVEVRVCCFALSIIAMSLGPFDKT